MIEFLISLLPGYIAALILFSELSRLEKIGIGALIGISIQIVVAIALGYNLKVHKITGGITGYNMYAILLVITGILYIIHILKKYKK